MGAVGKVAGKAVSATSWMVKGVCKFTGQAVAKSPLGTVIAGGVAYEGVKSQIHDNSFMEQVSQDFLSHETNENLQSGGLLKVANSAIFGQQNAENSVGRNVVDAVLGNGATDSIRARVVGDGTMPTDNNQPQQLSPGQMASHNPFSSYNDMVTNMTGGRMTGLNLATMLGAMYLVFGSRFGWLGKIAGLMMGGMTARSMEQNVQRIQQQQYQTSSVGDAGYPVGYEMPVESENQRIVSRMRM